MIDDDQRKALVAFFRSEVLPLGRDAAEDIDLPRAEGSLYRARGGERPRAEDLELSLGDSDEIADTLDRFWQGSALAGLGRKLLRLARRFPRGGERSDVSSDVYEMF